MMSIIFVSQSRSSGVMCDLESLNAANCYNRFKELLKRSWMQISMSNFKSEAKKIMDIIGQEDSLFIKPSRFGKIGGAHIIGLNDVDHYVDKYSIAEDEIMIVSSPIRITKEYRVIMKDDKAVTACQYKSRGSKGGMAIER